LTVVVKDGEKNCIDGNLVHLRQISDDTFRRFVEGACDGYQRMALVESFWQRRFEPIMKGRIQVL
jgi:hypothetical protein